MTMPSALHHHTSRPPPRRRPSSQAQPSLAGPSKASPPRPSSPPGSALVFLPSTTYAQPGAARPPAAARSSQEQVREQTALAAAADIEGAAGDPHDFYRPYRELFDPVLSPGLHQDALADDGAGPRGSRTRKASFRDLVARFDSPEEAPPPLPTLPHSSSPPRKASRASGSLGYGIVRATRRRGSEGSPMHSPHPMFPQWRPSAAAPARPSTAAPAVHGQPSTAAPAVYGQPSTAAPAFYHDVVPWPGPWHQHRRAHSDMSGTPSRGLTADAVLAGPAVDTRQAREQGREQAGARRRVHGRTTSGSRIPVSTGRASLTPDSGPHGRGKLILNGDKSPSLRANIIAPPPKISPQLRSSRPRLPVSAAASTASSRAKMAAERIQAMARNQHDARPSSRRARPPELSDLSDHADQESVNIVLRNTTYLDDDEAVAKGYRPLVLLRNTPACLDDDDGAVVATAHHRPFVPPPVPALPAAYAPPTAASGPASWPSSPAPSSDPGHMHNDQGADADAEESEGLSAQGQDDSASINSDHAAATDAYTIVNIFLQQHSASGVVDQQLVDDLYQRIVTHQPDLAECEVADAQRDPFAPAAFHHAHRYKSSLDSAEDWADTSPSVGDWIKYAAAGPDAERPSQQLSALMASMEQVARESASSASSVPPPLIDQQQQPPSIPPRLGSATHAPRLSTSSRSLTPRLSMSTSTRSLTPQGTAAPTADPAPDSEDTRQEQKRLKQRRHVLKELVDTEYSYERDLRVLCDIYKQTAVAALADDDVKVLFGNIEHVQTFARNFLTYLKQTAKPAYVMERQVDLRSAELSDADKDRQTRLGQAFIGSMVEMEAVYTEYIRTRHAANQRFEEISADKAVHEWLKECRSNSSDITNAWSLDALLVKPIQRITKYPLLLNELIASTAPDHPDLAHLRHAAVEMTEVNVRINEVKKHTELVDQVMNRKRKESDVRNGLTKAWGRRAEKLKQHVGLNETYEDGEFARLKMDYDNNCIHLFIVSKDCQGYVDALRSWIGRMVDMAVCAEAWVDIGHSNNPVAESKLRQLAMVVRGISTIAMPDHIDAVNRRVIAPMDKCKLILERFSLEPKGLIQKREKKLLDYSQAKNKKDRGERLDKRMVERMEQWEAINRETKQRMRKLREATASLVQACLAVLTHLHAEWYAVVEKKLAAAMALPLDQVAGCDIERDWQVDFDFYEATALALGICNGSLRNEAANMVSAFVAPASSSLLVGEDESPRQLSWNGNTSNNNTKRSASLNSNSPQFPPGPDAPSFRHSSQHALHLDHGPESPSVGAVSRLRAASLASSRVPRAATEGPGGRVPGAPPIPKPLALSRPGTGPHNFTLPQPPNFSPPQPPHFTPSQPPNFHSFTPPQPQRPGSSQTFVSAAPTPSTSAPNSAGLPAQQQHLLSSSSALAASDPLAAAAHNVPNPKVLFTVASMYEFNIDRTRQEAGLPYLTYAVGEIFDVVGERGELWMAQNQDDPSRTLGWIWCKHFVRLGG
ncbi:hypothetical protein DV737_g1845, partial [Chaetothyriales sp. CBS 132003]